jgi:hypothetical protein
LGLEIRHALGDTAQRFGVGPAGVKLAAQSVDVLLKPRKIGGARVECQLEPLVGLSERIVRLLFCDPMALRLCAQLAVAIGDDGLEPGSLRRVFSRDGFERLKRGLQLIERLADLTKFGGDALKFRLARQPAAFVGLSLLLDGAVQMLQLTLCRPEQPPQRLVFQLNLTEFFGLCAKLAVRIGPLAGELRLESRLLLSGPPAIGGDDVPGSIPTARGFGAGPREIPFEGGPHGRFFREPLDEFRLTRRRGSEGDGGAVLRLPMRRPGGGQPLLQRGVRGSVFRQGRVVLCLKRGEARPGGCQF